jgi:hypothetical protein
MIAKSYIEKNLRQIERLYNQSATVQKGLYFSKLALLELCGWIEISMDDIILRLAKRVLRDSDHLKYLKEEVIRRTYGFEYEKHFRRMLQAVIGLSGVERMERHVDPQLFQPMVAALTSLKPFRDEQAHQYIKGTTLTIDAPSVSRSRFYLIFNGLRNVDNVLTSLK